MCEPRFLDPELKRMLESSGYEYHFESKSKHTALVVAGKTVLHVPHTGRSRSESRTAILNARCCLRRHLKSLLHSRPTESGS